MRPVSQEIVTSTSETARESARSVHQSSPGEIQRKHLGWNSWRLSAGTCHHFRPFEWGNLPGIPPEHASAAHGGDTPCDTQRNVVPTRWRSSALQPASTSTSEQNLQREMDRERGTSCVVSKIVRLNTPRFFPLGACEECCVH